MVKRSQETVRKSTKRKRVSETDWARVDAMKDEDIDTSDSPELGPEFFKNAIFWPGSREKHPLASAPDLLALMRERAKRRKKD